MLSLLAEVLVVIYDLILFKSKLLREDLHSKKRLFVTLFCPTYCSVHFFKPAEKKKKKKKNKATHSSR